MFQINYSFSSSYEQSDVNYDSVDDTTIRYRLFLGSLILETKSSKIKLDWDWIPLLDFAVCFLSIYLEFFGKTHCKQQLEFTESDGLLHVEKQGKEISISTSYSDEIIEMSFDEFSSEIKRFYLSLTSEIKKKYKGIELNQYYVVYDNKNDTISI